MSFFTLAHLLSLIHLLGIKIVHLANNWLIAVRIKLTVITHLTVIEWVFSDTFNLTFTNWLTARIVSGETLFFL